MANGKELLSDNLVRQVNQLAQQQNREPAEVLEQAVQRYAAACKLERFVEKMEKRARSKNIREEDVPQLIAEVRRENQERGR